MQPLTTRGTRRVDAGRSSTVQDAVQPHWTAEHNQNLLPVSTSSCCCWKTRHRHGLCSDPVRHNLYPLSMLQNTCLSWERDLAGTPATEIQGSCSPADLLQPLCFKPLWSLYRAIFPFSQERLVILKFQDFGGLLLLLLFWLFSGFLGWLFFATVTTVCLDSYYRNSIHILFPWSLSSDPK